MFTNAGIAKKGAIFGKPGAPLEIEDVHEGGMVVVEFLDGWRRGEIIRSPREKLTWKPAGYYVSVRFVDRVWGVREVHCASIRGELEDSTIETTVDEWRIEGSPFLGRRVKRSILNNDGTVVGFSLGTVAGWLDAHESDCVSEYRNGLPCALFRVAYDSGPLSGDIEDLEECELSESLLEMESSSASYTTTWAESDRAESWRTEGSCYLRRRVKRSVFDSDGALLDFSIGFVVGWLDAHESDCMSEYCDEQCALFRVRFDTGPLSGDIEDLEECELVASLFLDAGDKVMARWHDTVAFYPARIDCVRTGHCFDVTYAGDRGIKTNVKLENIVTIPSMSKEFSAGQRVLAPGPEWSPNDSDYSLARITCVHDDGTVDLAWIELAGSDAVLRARAEDLVPAGEKAARIKSVLKKKSGDRGSETDSVAGCSSSYDDDDDVEDEDNDATIIPELPPGWKWHGACVVTPNGRKFTSFEQARVMLEDEARLAPAAVSACETSFKGSVEELVDAAREGLLLPYAGWSGLLSHEDTREKYWSLLTETARDDVAQLTVHVDREHAARAGEGPHGTLLDHEVVKLPHTPPGMRCNIWSHTGDLLIRVTPVLPNSNLGACAVRLAKLWTMRAFLADSTHRGHPGQYWAYGICRSVRGENGQRFGHMKQRFGKTKWQWVWDRTEDELTKAHVSLFDAVKKLYGDEVRLEIDTCGLLREAFDGVALPTGASFSRALHNLNHQDALDVGDNPTLDALKGHLSKRERGMRSHALGATTILTLDLATIAYSLRSVGDEHKVNSDDEFGKLVNSMWEQATRGVLAPKWWSAEDSTMWSFVVNRAVVIPMSGLNGWGCLMRLRAGQQYHCTMLRSDSTRAQLLSGLAFYSKCNVVRPLARMTAAARDSHRRNRGDGGTTKSSKKQRRE